MISLITGPKHAGMFCLCSHLLFRRKYSSIITVQWSRKIKFIGGRGQNTRHWTRAWLRHMHMHTYDAMNVYM